MTTKQSSAPARRDSTRSLLATPKNLADAAAWLMLDEEQEQEFRRCVEGEPLARMLGVVQWLADHEQDPDYKPEVMITGWAKKRGAGCFRPPESTAAERTWSGNSPEQDREMQEAVSKGGSSQSCSSWGMRFSPEQVQANLDRMQG